jgi:hypothetical protein
MLGDNIANGRDLNAVHLVDVARMRPHHMAAADQAQSDCFHLSFLLEKYRKKDSDIKKDA